MNKGGSVKIGLIIPANIKMSPYIQYYISYFKKNGIDYRTLVWDKLGIEKNDEYSFNYVVNDNNRIKILVGHMLFAQWCKRIIKNEGFDHLVIFTIAPLFFLGDSVLSRFKGKFIADIRDDSPFRRKFAHRLQKKCGISFSTVVSSPRYESWFGGKCTICHNADKSVIEKELIYTPSLLHNDTITIVFAGSLNESEKNIEVIERLKNNTRVKFVFVGRDNEGKQKVKDYVLQNGIKNVEFQGEYSKDQIVDIYRKQADLVNIFRVKCAVNTDALPNKLYDAVIAGIPIIVFEHNKAIAYYAKKYHLGLVIEDDDEIEESITNGYYSFSINEYQNGRTEFLDHVLEDFKEFELMLKRFIR